MSEPFHLTQILTQHRLSTDLNSQMRRIDLFCKLAGPLAIALIDGFSTKVAILATLVLNVMSIITEYHAIAKARSRHIH